MKIDHIGYAVENIEKAKNKLKGLGYTFGAIIEDNDRNVLLCFGELDGYRIELVAPGKEVGKGSPVDEYLDKVGPTPYHLCYISENIEDDIEQLKKLRYKVSVPLTPAIAFEGKRVVFMYSLTAGLLEIVEQ